MCIRDSDLADIKQPVKLGDFLFERHAAQKVSDAFVNGQGCMLVGVSHGLSTVCQFSIEKGMVSVWHSAMQPVRLAQRSAVGST